MNRPYLKKRPVRWYIEGSIEFVGARALFDVFLQTRWKLHRLPITWGYINQQSKSIGWFCVEMGKG